MIYHVVPMAREHLEQVEAIERLCFPDPWSLHLLEELLEHEGTVALAAVSAGGAVLGYTSAQTVLDEGYINNVAVHPAAGNRLPPAGGAAAAGNGTGSVVSDA